MRLSFVEPDNRDLRSVGVTPPLFEYNSSVGLCRVLSVDLSFKGAPKDLMTKFVDVLVRLPNLRTLELLEVSHRDPVTRGLKRKCAKFPSIREMIVSSTYPDFIKSCPNLESLTFRDGMDDVSTTLSSYGAELRRVGGVDICPSSHVECEFPGLFSSPTQPLNGPEL